MNVLPVITRELRAEARHPFTYWLRVLGAGAVILAAAVFILAHGLSAQLGAQLFQQLHITLQLAIWLVVPLLTADCISRERREGTLGLLFLTPLKALDIVIAKSLAHGLRAVTLLLAVLPVVALPLLMGGVTWQQAVSSLLLNGSALCLALAAGLLASAASKTWVRSLILAYSFAFTFAILYCIALGLMFGTNLRTGQFIAEGRWFEVGLRVAGGISPDTFYPYYSYRIMRGPWGAFAQPATVLPRFLLCAIESFALSVLELIFFALLAAWLTKRNWQDRPEHPFSIWFKQKLCTPVVMLDLLQRWMKRNLERNPIGWLEQRTWSGRLVIWGWFAVLISVYSLALTDANYFTRNITGMHVLMGWMLLLSMAVNASTSFRRERETRVLELLLVSPLSEGQIIMGRLRGLWGQFLPSMALLLSGWLYLSVALDKTEGLSFIVFFATSFITVPVIGLYFSLSLRNFLTSLITTVVVGMFIPAILSTTISAVAQITFHLQPPSPPVYIPLLRFIELVFHPGVIQLAVAAWLWWWLHLRLTQRRFATEST